MKSSGRHLTTDNKTNIMKYFSLFIVLLLIILNVFNIEVDERYIEMVLFLIIGTNSHYIGK